MQQAQPKLTIPDLALRSVENLKTAFQSDPKMRCERPLRYETLEDRRVLSATGFEPVDAVDPGTALVAKEDYGDSVSESQSLGVASLLVNVNGKQIEITPASQTLQLAEGDFFEVVGIGFSSTAKTGVFAAEGYVSKLSDTTSASTVDYNDGRFSEPDSNQQATGAEGAIGGLKNGWTVEKGWDRLTINLMHYTESATEVADNFLLTLQVGEPDLQFDTATLDQIQDQSIQVGDSVTIPARWLNKLDGTFHNYAEVDIYQSSNMEQIVWAGASVGNVNSDNPVEGEFLNNQSDDPFAQKWTPLVKGEYVLKYYLDPEAAASETDESNNEYEIRVTVGDELAPQAVDDFFNYRRGKQNVLKNDLPVNSSDKLKVAEYSQAEHGKVSLSKNGKLDYRPDKGFVGTDHFTYVATDGDQLSNEAVVTINVDRQSDHGPKKHKSANKPFERSVQTEYKSVSTTDVSTDSKLNIQHSVRDGLVQLDRVKAVEFQIVDTSIKQRDHRADFTKAVDVIAAPAGHRADFGSHDLRTKFESSVGFTQTQFFNQLEKFSDRAEGRHDQSNWDRMFRNAQAFDVQFDPSELSDRFKGVFKQLEISFDLDSFVTDAQEKGSGAEFRE